MMSDQPYNEQRKSYYVSVQAGQILEDQQAASYELEISANEKQVEKLKILFEELSSGDERDAIHFAISPYGTASDQEMNGIYDETIQNIYKLLYECGTNATKRHIESMHLLN